ncbi:hypothetical protein [Caminibacter sp.]
MKNYAEELYGIIKLYSYIGEKINANLTKEDLLEFVDIVNHYKEHAKKHSLTVTAIEPYKVISWGSVSLCLKYQKNDIKKAKYFLVLAILSLNVFLKEDVGKNHSSDFLKKVYKMLMLECQGDKNFGIGRNGLYMIFKSASLIYH